MTGNNGEAGVQEDRSTVIGEDSAASEPIPPPPSSALTGRDESVSTFLQKARHDAETYEQHRDEVQAKLRIQTTGHVSDEEGVSGRCSPQTTTQQVVITKRKRKIHRVRKLPTEKLSGYDTATAASRRNSLSPSSPSSTTQDADRSGKRGQTRLAQSSKMDMRTRLQRQPAIPVQDDDGPTVSARSVDRPATLSTASTNPGAVRMYVRSANVHDDSDNFLVHDSIFTNVSFSHDDDLSSTSAVPADTENVLRAIAVNDETVTAEPMKPGNKRRRRFMFFSLLAIIVLLVVVLSVVLTRDNAARASFAPSFSPSQSPSYSTIGLEEFIEQRTPESDRDQYGSSGLGDSPRQKAFDWLSQDPNLGLYSDDRILQRYALATIYFSLHGDRWLNSKDWLSFDIDECSWYSAAGEACNKDDQIVSLELRSNSLQGELPAVISLLTNMEKLDLGKNQVSGTIPTMISGCTLLESIDLSSNSLSGEIPVALAFPESLSNVDLSDNDLTGFLPPEFGQVQQLTSLRLASNALTGQIPVDLFLGSSSSLLQFLDLSDNDFTGQIPTELGHGTQLLSLNIDSNAFISSLPSEIGFLTALTSLRAKSCGLEGPVPAHVSGLALLEYLDLSENGLSGSLPTSMENITTLTHFDVSHNSLTSSVPAEIANLQSLLHVDISHNFLTGQLFRNDDSEEYIALDFNNTSVSMGNALSNLRYLDLGSNRFSGAFLSDIGHMSDLRVLRSVDSGFGSISNAQGWTSLSNLEELEMGFGFKVEFDFSSLTRLTRLRKFRLQLPESLNFGVFAPSPLPTEIGLLTRLESFSIIGFSLSTCIPSAFGQLTRLRDLQLDGVFQSSTPCSLPSELGLLRHLSNLHVPNNRIDGTIPASLGSLSNLNAVNLAHNSISGQIPTTIGLLRRLTSLDISVNQLSGLIPTELSLVPHLDELLLYDNPALSGTFPRDTFAIVTSVYGTNISGTMPSIYCDHLRETRCTDLPTADAVLFGDCHRPNFVCECCTFCCGEGDCMPVPAREEHCGSGEATGAPLTTRPTASPSFSVAQQSFSRGPSLSPSPSRGPRDATSLSPTVDVSTMPRAKAVALTLTMEFGGFPEALRLTLDKMLNKTVVGESDALEEILFSLPPPTLDMSNTTTEETVDLLHLEEDSSLLKSNGSEVYYRIRVSDPTGNALRRLELDFWLGEEDDRRPAGCCTTDEHYEFRAPFGRDFVTTFSVDTMINQTDDEELVADFHQE